MTVVDNAKEKMITLVDGVLSNGQFGDSNQTVTVLDTDLISELTSSVKAVSGSPNAKQLLITHNLLSTESNGVTLREYGNFMTDGTSEVLLNRVTFTDLPKSNALEVQTKTLLQVV
jgi:hypothetical protein